MLKIKITFGTLLLCCSLIVFSGCGIKQQKNDDGNSVNVNTEALAQFQKEQKELLAKANAELSAINKKILACNDKIREKGGKLTEAQNKALDEFEEQRASINQRIHQIKNVKMADWEKFKSSFETDLNEASSNIEKIMTEL
jgi:Skp family chaperone for outer membrane proteins